MSEHQHSWRTAVDHYDAHKGKRDELRATLNYCRSGLDDFEEAVSAAHVIDLLNRGRARPALLGDRIRPIGSHGLHGDPGLNESAAFDPIGLKPSPAA